VPKRTHLTNQHIGVERPAGGEDVWRIVLTDRAYGDQLILDIGRDARDELVKMLTGGIVLAGGELPRLPPNPGGN
jgi:hypothetical protein